MVVIGLGLKFNRAASCVLRSWDDWAAWLPGTCQVGRLVRRLGGLPRQMFK